MLFVLAEHHHGDEDIFQIGAPTLEVTLSEAEVLGVIRLDAVFSEQRR